MEEAPEYRPTAFDSAVAAVTGSDVSVVTNAIANTTSEKVVLICRRAFGGVHALLKPMLKGLRDFPVESVEDAEESLTKIHEQYWELKEKGGIDDWIIEEIDTIMPDLQEALAYISSAVTFQRIMDPKKDKNEYIKNLPLYGKQLLQSYERIANIYKVVRGYGDTIDTG